MGDRRPCPSLAAPPRGGRADRADAAARRSYRRRHPKAPVATINRAYQMAAEAHRSQLRSSGESYINHPLAVARIVADIGLDEISVAAALLHDAVEDTEITLADVEARLRRRGRRDRRRRHQARAASSSTPARRSRPRRCARCWWRWPRDLRVLVIKLADRLHNMRTIAGDAAARSSSASPRRRSTSTPRWPTASACRRSSSSSRTSRSPSLHPKRFAELDHLVSTRTPEREVYLAKAIAEVARPAAELGIEAEVTGRGKHLWSIYEKMVRQGPRVRRHLRPRRDPGHRRLDQGLLRRARAASTAAGSRWWVGSRTTSRCRSSTSTRACTRR